MKYICALLFICCFCSALNAQNTFEKIIDTLGGSYASCIKSTFDGGYVLCGGSVYNGNDALVIKLDSAGTIEWAKTYGGSGGDGATYIEQTLDSGYMVSAVYTIGINSLSWLLRLDINGDTLWTKTLSLGSGSTNVAANNSMASINNSIYALTGYYASLSQTTSAYFISYLSNGVLLTSKTYPTPFSSDGEAICRSYNYGFALTGQYGTSSSTADVYLIRTDPYGDTLWTKTYHNSQGSVGRSVASTMDNGFVIAGATYNVNFSKYNLYIIKTDTIGDTLWTKQYGGSTACYANSVEQIIDGGYIVVGRIVNGNPINGDVYLVKLDANGDTLWTRQFGGTNEDEGIFVRQTADGGYIIVGSGSNFGTGGIYIIKTDSMGIVHSLTGAAELNNPLSYTIYPNPTSGVFTVAVKGIPKNNSSLEIYNITNECVYSCKINNNATERIDLSTMSDGIYMVMIRTKNNIYSRKIIIQK